MRALRLIFAILVFVAGLVPPAPAEAAALDFPFPNGHFFTQAGQQPGLGYAITDDGGMRFWSEFNRLGGVSVLGYPASWRFIGHGGFIYQLTQGALLQWQPEENRAVLANSFEMLQAAGLDGWLAQTRGIPPGVTDDGSAGDLSRAAAVRLDWLTDERIRQHYLANPNSLAYPTWGIRESIGVYGLPMSPPKRSGPFLIQRFQRVALQLWVEPVPGMPPPGTVVRVLAGDILKEAGLIPPDAATPLAASSPLARVDPGLRPVVEMLRADEFSRDTADILLGDEMEVVFAPMPANVAGLFSPSTLTIIVNSHWSSADPKALAAILAHEASHARDYGGGLNVYSTEGCYATEVSAFTAQTKVWEHYFGPRGKRPAVNQLEQSLNSVLHAVTRDSGAFVKDIESLYEHQCLASR